MACNLDRGQENSWQLSVERVILLGISLLLFINLWSVQLKSSIIQQSLGQNPKKEYIETKEGWSEGSTYYKEGQPFMIALALWKDELIQCCHYGRKNSIVLALIMKGGANIHRSFGLNGELDIFMLASQDDRRTHIQHSVGLMKEKYLSLRLKVWIFW